jgi:hypothetical protein
MLATNFAGSQLHHLTTKLLQEALASQILVMDTTVDDETIATIGGDFSVMDDDVFRFGHDVESLSGV